MTGFSTLDAWVGDTLGLPHPPSRADLAAYQLRQLNETLTVARTRSPFYRTRTDWPARDALASLADIASLPFTTAADLARADPPLIALPLRDAARLVTLPTSGTSGPSKRLFFTEEDLAATVAYFEHGMATFVAPGSRVAIAFPAAKPDSVGDLLARGLRQLGAVPERLPLDDTAAAVAALRVLRPTAIAGMPVTLGALARHMAADGGPQLRIETALVSADTVSPSLKAALATIWDTEVFEHWGMTETGYGGALACRAHDGLHIRETDLIIEIVDAHSGKTLPDDAEGEIVVTTLRRTGLPLIRYRTGDRGSLVAAPCRCGSILRRLRLAGRIAATPPCTAGMPLPPDILDDAIFAVDTVVDFAVALSKAQLVVDIVTSDPAAIARVRAALCRHPVVGPILRNAPMAMAIRQAPSPLPLCRKRARLAPDPSPSPLVLPPGAEDAPPGLTGSTAAFRAI